MTKTYIKPETVIVKVDSQQILAGSPGGISDENATGPAEGKGFTFFEEEEIETEE